MITLEELKKSVLIKFNRQDKVCFVVKENRSGVKILLEEIEDVDVLYYIFINGIEERYSYDVKKYFGEIYEYVISNGGSYEFLEHVELYSRFFLLKEEFDAMVKKAIKNINKRDVYYVAAEIKRMYPEYFIDIGKAAGTCTCEWNCKECDSPLRDE